MFNDTPARKQIGKEGHIMDVLVSSSINNPFEVMDKCNKFKYFKLSAVKNEQFLKASPTIAMLT